MVQNVNIVRQRSNDTHTLICRIVEKLNIDKCYTKLHKLFVSSNSISDYTSDKRFLGN